MIDFSVYSNTKMNWPPSLIFRMKVKHRLNLIYSSQNIVDFALTEG